MDKENLKGTHTHTQVKSQSCLIKEIFQVLQVSNKVNNKVRRYDNKDSGEVNAGGKTVKCSLKMMIRGVKSIFW